MKCIIEGCQNQTHEGEFIGKICSPCYSYLVDGKGTTSQAYRNQEELKQLKTAIKLIYDTLKQEIIK